MQNLNLQELLIAGKSVDVVLFIVCPHCQGLATYKHTLKGGPYGIDRTYDENCRRCYQEHGKATGKKMVKMSLQELVTAIRDT
jgi:hypothetical protein